MVQYGVFFTLTMLGAMAKSHANVGVHYLPATREICVQAVISGQGVVRATAGSPEHSPGAQFAAIG